MRSTDSSLFAAAVMFAASSLLSVAAAQGSAETPARPMIAIESVGVVDVERGEIVSPRTIMIVDGRIDAIGEPAAISIPPEAVRVDGHGRYLMPGLVDMHVHLFNNATHRLPNDWTFPLFVANGVTALREMAAGPADMPTVRGWRAAAARGDLVAPHVLATGVAVNGDSLHAARLQVREAHAAGADFVKVFSPLQEPHWRAIVEEARALQIPVCGHIPAAMTLLVAARAGQCSNEHLTQVYEACSSSEARSVRARRGLDGRRVVQLSDAQERDVLENFDQRVCDRTAASLAATAQAQVPTLVLPHFEVRGSAKNFRDDPRWPYLRSDEQERWVEILAKCPADSVQMATQRLEVSRNIVKTLHTAGVRILAGTDAPMPLVYPGFALHKELELLVDSGLSTADALRAATIRPAEFLGIAEISGSIALGKRADLVLLDENPLGKISNTERIRAVVLDGRLLHRADLDGLLSGAADVPK
jgi:imidazolonepropionase-like amidohydrolase